jgi:hypothetical protein
MNENPLLNLFGDDAFDEDRDGVPATQPVQVPHIDVAALRQRADSRPPTEVARVVEEIDRLTFARDALDIGRDYRELGEFDRACHWFTVAAAYGAQDADAELASTMALHEVFASIADPDTTTSDNAGGVRTRRERGIFRKAAEVLTKARRAANETLRDAEKKAVRITSAARFQALLATGLGSRSAVEGDSSAALVMAMLGHFRDVQIHEIAEATLDVSPFGARNKRTAESAMCTHRLAEAVKPMARRAAFNTWMETVDECARPLLRYDAGRLGLGGSRRWHVSDHRGEPTAFPWLPSSALSELRIPAAHPLKLFDPGWDPGRAGHPRTPRERITPGPKLRRALNRLSARTPPADAALPTAG